MAACFSFILLYGFEEALVSTPSDQWEGLPCTPCKGMDAAVGAKVGAEVRSGQVCVLVGDEPGRVEPNVSLEECRACRVTDHCGAVVSAWHSDDRSVLVPDEGLDGRFVRVIGFGGEVLNGVPIVSKAAAAG